MKPVLHDGSSRTIDFSQGTRIGTLTDCISCRATEERNGPFELELQYAVSGRYYDSIVNGNVVIAVPSDGAEETAFDIYKVSRPMNGRIKVNARHVTYRMRYTMVRPGVVTSPLEFYLSGEYYGGANSLLVNPCAFKVRSDFSVSGNMNIATPRTLRETLQGSAGSVIQTFGGELEWKTDGAYLHSSRGVTRTTGIRYGKNLIDLKQEEAIDNMYDAAYPYWTDGQNVVTGDIQKFTTNAQRVMLLDLSSYFDSQPTVAQLNSRCQSYVNANCRGVPTVSLSVKFAPLWLALGYEDLDVERVQLCDEVPVIFEQLGVTATAKVNKTDFNVLTERYNSIELGSSRITASKTIARLTKATGVSLY